MTVFITPMRKLAAVTALAFLTAGPAVQAQLAVASTPANNHKALADLFASEWEYDLKNQPEMATAYGDNRYNDRLSDYSSRGYNEQLAHKQQILQQLILISPEGLSPEEKISRDMTIYDIGMMVEEANFKPWEMPVNQFWGVHTQLPDLVSYTPFNTTQDYENWIARLRQIPRVLQESSDDIEQGIDDKRVPPRYLLEKVVAQTRAIADQKAEDSPFAQPLNKFPGSVSAPDQQRLKLETLDVIQKQVLPAYSRFANFMQKVYVPAGRTEPGAWSLPDGDAYYAFCVRKYTTTNKTPAEIHQIGLDEVARDEAEMLKIAQKLGFNDIQSFRLSVAKNPKFYPTSKEELVDRYRHYIDGMRPRLPQLFGVLPKAPVEVVAMPAFVEKNQAAAYYSTGTPDGSRPGRVNINTYNFASRSLLSSESIAYHEGIPGHHLQLSIAQEITGVPEFRKHASYNAFVEGWGLYSERLGKDIGLYQDPYSDYGRLEADIWRAIRLVVDTGVHSKHWTREQMVDYFHAHSAIDQTNIDAETDRYIAWPGQALAYKMGQLKILELRQRAQTALGPKFNVKAFHDQVLTSGALPLDTLEHKIDAWIATQKGTSSSN